MSPVQSLQTPMELRNMTANQPSTSMQSNSELFLKQSLNEIKDIVQQQQKKEQDMFKYLGKLQSKIQLRMKEIYSDSMTEQGDGPIQDVNVKFQETIRDKERLKQQLRDICERKERQSSDVKDAKVTAQRKNSKAREEEKLSRKQWTRNHQNFIAQLHNDQDRWDRYVDVLNNQTTFDSRKLFQNKPAVKTKVDNNNNVSHTQRSIALSSRIRVLPVPIENGQSQ